MFSHFLFVTVPAIGHLAPLASLAAKLIEERPDTIITLPVLGKYGELVEKQLGKHFSAENLHLKENIRLINLGGQNKSSDDLIIHLSQCFEPFYLSLCTEKAIKCQTGRVYPGIPKPKMVLLEFLSYNLFVIVRKLSDRIPILAWNSFSSAFTMYFFGPEKFGGRGNLSEKAAALSKQTGRPFAEVEAELHYYYSLQGNVVRLPGFPGLYDYELVEEDDSIINVLKDPAVAAVKASFNFLPECDGMVSLSNDFYEPELNAAFRQWFNERNKPTYFIGPVIPSDRISTTKGSETPSNVEEVPAYLDKVLNTFGERSMLYISFGSLFWPKGDIIWKILEAIVEMRIPFLLAYTRSEEMPSHISALLSSYDYCLISRWAPQHAILAHHATGWFLTHCGQNSVTEAISQGMPMIAWPINGDQFLNAISVALRHDFAYQLLEVLNPKPFYSGVIPKGTVKAAVEEFREIWIKAQGEDGARKRSNIQDMQKKYKTLWEEKGYSRKDFKKFAEDCFNLN